MGGTGSCAPEPFPGDFLAGIHPLCSHEDDDVAPARAPERGLHGVVETSPILVAEAAGFEHLEHGLRFVGFWSVPLVHTLLAARHDHSPRPDDPRPDAERFGTPPIDLH